MCPHFSPNLRESYKDIIIVILRKLNNSSGIVGIQLGLKQYTKINIKKAALVAYLTYLKNINVLDYNKNNRIWSIKVKQMAKNPEDNVVAVKCNI